MEGDPEGSPSPTILDVLNEDCWRAILDYLNIRDIIRSERVSRQWQHVMFQYLQGAQFSIQYPWYDHDTRRNFRILIMDQDDPYKFDSITRKWGPNIKKVDCINKNSLKVIRRNCPNVEDITFYALHYDVLSNGRPKNLKKLRRVHFRGCDYITDKCVSQWLTNDSIKELVISGTEKLTGLCLAQHSANLTALLLRECTALEFRHLLSADLTGLTKLELIYVPKEIFLNVHLLIDRIPCLEDLCLRWEKKMDMGLGLVEAVGRMRGLGRLDLSFNPNVTDEWLEVAARGCGRLQELVVEGCLGVSARGVSAVCRAARASLRALNVGSNGKILDHHVEEFIATCPNLTWLDVSQCWEVSDGLAAVAAQAARPGQALRLHVSGTRVGGPVALYREVAVVEIGFPRRTFVEAE